MGKAHVGKTHVAKTHNIIRRGRNSPVSVWVSQTKTGQTKKKKLLNTKGAYGTKFENEMHFMPFSFFKIQKFFLMRSLTLKLKG